MVEPHGSDSRTTLDELQRNGGPEVVILRRLYQLFVDPPVPAALRFRPASARELIEGIAIEQGFKPVWVRGGRCVCLCMDEPEADVDSVLKGLADQDVTIRREAAWKGGWVEDIRLISPLIKAASDPDPETASWAKAGLRLYGWRTICAIDDAAIDLLSNECRSRKKDTAMMAAAELGHIDPQRGLPLIQMVLDSREISRDARIEAVRSLRSIPRDQAMPILRDLLSIEDTPLRSAVIETLGALKGDAALDVALSSLNDPDDGVRDSAIEAVGRIGGDAAWSALRKLLTSPRKQVPFLASMALVSHGGATALDNLVAALNTNQGDRPRIWSICRAFGQDNGPESMACLQHSLTDANPAIRRGIVRALCFEPPARALPLLKQVMADPNDNVRTEIADTLGVLGGHEAFVMLTVLLQDPECAVRSQAAFRLGEVDDSAALSLLSSTLSAHEDSRTRSAAYASVIFMAEPLRLPFLEKALVDPDKCVQTACDSYHIFGSDLAPLLAKMQSDGDPIVRGVVASFLADVGGERALPMLEKAVADTDRDVRIQAALTLGEIGGHQAFAILKPALQDPDPKVRNAALRALGFVGVPQALEQIASAFNDRSADIRTEAILALNDNATLQSVPLWRLGMKDADAKVRQMTAISCGSLPVAQALPLLAIALKDPDGNVQSFAFGTLDQTCGDQALPLLQSALEDKDPAIRIDAIDSLALLGGREARSLIINHIAIERNLEVLNRIDLQLRTHFPITGMVQDALRDVALKIQYSSGPSL